MAELKPCPFCGGEARVVERCYPREVFHPGSLDVPDIVEGSRYSIACEECGAMQYESETLESVVEMWNRRAERTCQAVLPPYEPGIEEIPVCSECGRQLLVEEDADEYCPRCGARVVWEE